MIGRNTEKFGFMVERGLKDLWNIIPETRGSGRGACGMARTLDPVTIPDSPLCQVKQQLMRLEPKTRDFQRLRVRRQVAKTGISVEKNHTGTSNI